MKLYDMKLYDETRGGREVRFWDTLWFDLRHWGPRTAWYNARYLVATWLYPWRLAQWLCVTAYHDAAATDEEEREEDPA